MLGRAMSLLTLAPYSLWRREHAMHHAGSGNLDRRGVGDIETWTVDEYLSKGWFSRLRYRVYRNPAFLFGFGVPAYFVLVQRLPWGHGLPFRDAWKSITALNVAIALVYGSLAWVLGVALMLKVFLPIVVVASALGGWLFFIQHQFEETQWDLPASWDFQSVRADSRAVSLAGVMPGSASVRACLSRASAASARAAKPSSLSVVPT